uniref:Uncharacterized protein n=1 Tax=viral metagenome TaxID=1070528 RepID=A0A6C0BCA3_9ZZZZ
MSQVFELPKDRFNMLNDDESNKTPNLQKGVKFVSNAVEKLGNDNKEVVTSEVTTKSKKPSMSSFLKKSVKTSEQVVDNSNKVDKSKGQSSDILVYSELVTTKVSYDYSEYKPKISSKNKKNLDWSNAIQTEKQKMRELDERVAKNDVMDLFGSSQKETVPDIDNDPSLIVSKFNEILAQMTKGDVVSKKSSKDPENVVLISSFLECLSRAILYLNAEEKGRIILNCIFGGLISPAKLSTVSSTKISGSLGQLSVALNSLVSGGVSSSTDKLFTSLNDAILSPKLNRYRIETTGKEQIENFTSFIRQLSATKTIIYFPTNLTITDPFPKEKIPKKASINNTPSLEDLKSFFIDEKPKGVKKIVTKSKKYDDDDDDDGNADIEDRMNSKRNKETW